MLYQSIFLEDGDFTVELSQFVDNWIFPRIKDNLGESLKQTKINLG